MAIISGSATPGNDRIIADGANDRIDALAGNDIVDGGAGNDTLLGNTGNDILVGGLGSDSLDGGAGVDRVVESGDINFSLFGNLLSGKGFDTLNSIEIVQLTGGAGNNGLNATLAAQNISFAFNGGAGNDTLNGGSRSDTLTGGLGNDFLNGGLGGTDLVSESGDVNFTLTNTSLTGNGTDSLTSIETAVLAGGVSNNRIDASDFNRGSVTINGQGGNDVLEGGSRSDVISGGIGNDRIIGNNGDDRLDGGDGNDTLTGGITIGGFGRDTLTGGNGIDTVLLSNADRSRAGSFILTNTSLTSVDAVFLDTDTLSSIERVTFNSFSDNQATANQGDFFTAASFTLGSVTLSGGAERDTLIGSAGSDSISGSGGSDDLLGEAGNDTIRGGSGDDRIEGGNGNDSLDGSSGFDTIFGGNGDDTIRDGSISDEIGGYFGEGGNDTLLGAGNFLDFLNGGAGNDLLTGGGGKNNFDFNSGREFATADLGIDTISDFSPVGDNDLIRLADKTFTAITPIEGGLSSADFALVINDASAGSSSAKIVYNVNNGNLFYNSDTTVAGFGTGGQFAVIAGPNNLSASDFFLDVV